MPHNVSAGAVHRGHHIVPARTLITIFGALVGFTILTFVTSQLDLGGLNVPLALAIACTKAALVVMFFMGLKYDSPMNTLVFSVGVIFVMLFLTFTLFDTINRGDVENLQRTPITDQEREAEAILARQPRSNPAVATDSARSAEQQADTAATRQNLDSTAATP